MSNRSLLLFVVLPLGIYSLAVHAASDLSPEQKLKAQVQALTEQIVTLQANLAQCQLTTAAENTKVGRKILEAEFRASLKCAEDDELEGWPPTGCKKAAKTVPATPKPPQ